MQTGFRMANLDSTHFSDKLSYKILCTSTYGLGDMNHARFKHFLQKNKRKDMHRGTG
jgi:hypothetical protein